MLIQVEMTHHVLGLHPPMQVRVGFLLIRVILVHEAAVRQ